ncbi:MAG: hypothetical protein ABI216_05610 [Devosia sp.]
MAKRWRKVPTDADVVQLGGRTIIRITRGTRGDAMASVERMEWVEPDGHEYTGYADSTTDRRRRPAGEVMAEYRTALVVVAIESEDLWDPDWGELRSDN